MADEIRSIDCRTAVQQLWDYLDEELDDRRMLEVRAHLETCRACLPHADFDQRFLEALSRVRELHVMPPAVRSQVMAALARDGFLQAD
jgi:anti-sigma factor (TIGR02949 family)